MGRYGKPGFWQSLKQAWHGIVYTVRTQKHMRYHLRTGVFVLLLAWLTEVSPWEWVMLIVAIGCVISAEVMNSAVEVVVDMVQPNYHPLAGMAKDIAAGAVLVMAIQAVIIGFIIFVPQLYHLVRLLFERG